MNTITQKRQLFNITRKYCNQPKTKYNMRIVGLYFVGIFGGGVINSCIFANKEISVKGSTSEDLFFASLFGFFNGCWIVAALPLTLLLQTSSFICNKIKN